MACKAQHVMNRSQNVNNKNNTTVLSLRPGDKRDGNLKEMEF